MAFTSASHPGLSSYGVPFNFSPSSPVSSPPLPSSTPSDLYPGYFCYLCWAAGAESWLLLPQPPALCPFPVTVPCPNTLHIPGFSRAGTQAYLLLDSQQNAQQLVGTQHWLNRISSLLTGLVSSAITSIQRIRFASPRDE